MQENNIEISPEFWRDDLDNREVMVSIRCITYNHESYIRDALEGFVNQKTNFRFEAIVHDDASTDGTAAIIREYAEKYPSIIKPIYETENQYSKSDGSLSRIMASHLRGKYLAYCEGDDYWINPLKLQKQVDFLETHIDYGMVYAKTQFYFQKDNRFGKYFGKATNLYDLLRRNTIPTLSVLCRADFEKEYLKFMEGHQFKVGDYPRWLFIAKKSKIQFMDELMAIYRRLEESASHSQNYNNIVSFSESINEMKAFFNDKFKIVNPNTLNDWNYYDLMHIALLNGNSQDVLKFYKKINKPSFKATIKYLINKYNLIPLYNYF